MKISRLTIPLLALIAVTSAHATLTSVADPFGGTYERFENTPIDWLTNPNSAYSSPNIPPLNVFKQGTTFLGSLTWDSQAESCYAYGVGPDNSNGGSHFQYTPGIAGIADGKAGLGVTTLTRTSVQLTLNLSTSQDWFGGYWLPLQSTGSIVTIDAYNGTTKVGSFEIQPPANPTAVKDVVALEWAGFYSSDAFNKLVVSANTNGFATDSWRTYYTTPGGGGTPPPVPEPTPIVAMGLGVVGLVVRRRK